MLRVRTDDSIQVPGRSALNGIARGKSMQRYELPPYQTYVLCMLKLLEYALWA